MFGFGSLALPPGGQGARDPLAALFARYSATGFLFDKLDPAYRQNGLALQYETSLGAVAVDAATDSVGLALDRSQSVNVGSDLVTNGDMSSSTGWSLTDFTISGGVLTAADTDSVKRAIATCPVTAENFYRVSWSQQLGGSSGGTNHTKIGVWDSGEGFQTNYINGAGDKEIIIRATKTGDIYIYNFEQGLIYDDLVVRQVSGNHAYQATSGARPTLQMPGTKWLWRGDGSDDGLLSIFSPTTSMTLLEVGTPAGGSAGDVIMGSQPASDGRAYLGLDANGYLAGGVGAEGTSTIVDSGATDIRTVRCGKAIRWNGTTVDLFRKLPGGGLENVYSAAQSGAANTTIPVALLALNNNGSLAANYAGDTEYAQAVSAALTDADINAALGAAL